jgi:hypothetical protein
VHQPIHIKFSVNKATEFHHHKKGGGLGGGEAKQADEGVTVKRLAQEFEYPRFAR